MLFDRFLKKRRAAAAAAAAPPSQESLRELARGHADPGVRLDAVRRLADLAFLRDLLSGDGDAPLRELASVRYRHLVAGSEDAGLDLNARLAELPLIQDPWTIAHLAREAREPELRRAALERVTFQETLIECAVQDPVAAIRGSALARIEDRTALEQVARRSAKKDKAVYRTAREKLRLIAEREEEPRRIRAQCADLCERAERLGHLENWTQDRALLEHLDRQWTEIAPRAEPELAERFSAARERFLAAFDAHRDANAAQIAAQDARAALRAQREGLLAEAAALAALETESAIRAGRERLTVAWSELERLPESEQRGLEARFARSMAAAQSAEQAMAEHRRGVSRLRKTVARAEKICGESKPLDLAQVRTLIEQGRSLAAELRGGAAGEDCVAAFAEVSARLETRLKTQRRHAEQRLAELPERLAELETLVESGELKKADPIHQSIQAALDLIQSSGLPKGAAEPIAARLRVLTPRLRDLHHWRRWGADQHREALCEAMATLRDQDLPLEAVAERLHVLKTDWKELDHSGSPANQTLWQRFHESADAVQARIQPLLAAQAAEWEGNRTAREQVCQQLEDFLARVDWERVDWKRVMRAEREIRHAWSLIGPCEARSRYRLDRRFHKGIKQLDERLESERARNQALKQGLVARVESLAAVPDLEAAIEEAKGLQRQWHTTVPARQREENRLWQAFRAGCDVVFQRRAAVQQAHRGELQANLSARETLCDEALDCADRETDPDRLAAALRDLESRWREAESLPVPRQSAAALARRWSQARERLQRRRRDREEAARRAAADTLARQAALCESVERALLDGDGPLPGALETELAWSAIPQLPDRALQAAMAVRLRTALEATADPGRLAELRGLEQANRPRRERLCLELEIAAGVESPPDLAQERLRLQVSRLAERMVEGEGDSLRGVPELLREWYLCGPAPRDARLEERLARILKSQCAAREEAPEPADAEPA